MPVAAVVAAEDEDDVDDDDDVDADDVEASLDEILKERLVVPEEEEDEDEAPDTEDRTADATKVLPKQPDEFVCQSCFLVKHPSQLADGKRSTAGTACESPVPQRRGRHGWLADRDGGGEGARPVWPAPSAPASPW